MNKYKFLKMKFYEVLRGTVSMRHLAKYFGYKIDDLGNIRAYFGEKEKQEIHLDTKAKGYIYVKSGKWGGNFVSFFIKASKECFKEDYSGWEAMKEIRRLLNDHEIIAYDNDYLFALKHFLHRKKARGKDKIPRKKRVHRVDYEKPEKQSRWHKFETWEHNPDDD